MEMLKPISLKRVVAGRGHDCGGLIADIYFNKKHIANYHDDGRGGEPELTFFKDSEEKQVFDFIKERGVEKHMMDTDWSNDLWKDGIGIHSVLHCSIEFIAQEMEDLKYIRANQGRKLILEKEEQIFTLSLGTSIAKIKTNPKLIDQLNNIIEREKKEGYAILNTNLKEIIK